MLPLDDPPFLHDCLVKSSESELFLVVSDSIYSHLLTDRDRFTQAVLHLGEDIFEAKNGSLETALGSKSFRTLIAAIGVGVYGGQQIDPSKARYGRIIIISQQSKEGTRFVRCILAVLRKYFQPLVDEGLVYSRKFLDSES